MRFNATFSTDSKSHFRENFVKSVKQFLQTMKANADETAKKLKNFFMNVS